MSRLYVDMDGTVTEYRRFEKESQYTQRYYYSSLKPIANVVEALWILHKRHPDLEIYIISACPKGAYAEDEKDEWLDTHMSFIDKDHRIFCYIGENKVDYIGTIGPDDYLYDDYKKNLKEWAAAGGTPIKSLNGLNSEPKNNAYSAIAANNSSQVIADMLFDIIVNKNAVHDSRDEIQLRNEQLGLTLIMSKKELSKIVDEFFPEYDGMNEFRTAFNSSDWMFVRRYAKQATIERNTSMAQMSFELETLKKEILSIRDSILDTFKNFKCEEVRYEIDKKYLETKIAEMSSQSYKGHKRQINRMVADSKVELENAVKEFSKSKESWEAYHDSALAHIRTQCDQFFGKYEIFLNKDEGYETACRHAKEDIESEIRAIIAATEEGLCS